MAEDKRVDLRKNSLKEKGGPPRRGTAQKRAKPQRAEEAESIATKKGLRSAKGFLDTRTGKGRARNAGEVT